MTTSREVTPPKDRVECVAPPHLTQYRCGGGATYSTLVKAVCVNRY